MDMKRDYNEGSEDRGVRNQEPVLRIFTYSNSKHFTYPIHQSLF
jgi:hypothetical protein